MQAQGLQLFPGLPFATEGDFTGVHGIAAPPVTWGWSICVAKNGADEWAIVRRKLMLPTVGHEGLQLPHWHNQLIACEQGYTA